MRVRAMLELVLPFPPSVNNTWEIAGKKIIIKPHVVKFRHTARAMAIRQARGRAMICEPVCVWMVFYPPDKRRRDLDNLPKSVFDVLTKAKIWQDDKLVHEMHLKWGEEVPLGKAIVKIKRIAERSCEFLKK